MKRRANGRSLSVAATACSVLLAVSRAAIAQDTPAATVSGDQAVVDRVTTQLVDLMPDDSKVASLKIKRLLDLLPDNFDYTSSKVMRQAKCRVAAYEIERVMEKLPQPPRKPKVWHVGGWNQGVSPMGATVTGVENCPGCQANRAHNCRVWFLITEMMYEDGAVEEYTLPVNVYYDPYAEGDPTRQRLKEANDENLATLQRKYETDVAQYSQTLREAIPTLKQALNSLRALDKEGTYENAAKMCGDFLSSVTK